MNTIVVIPKEKAIPVRISETNVSLKRVLGLTTAVLLVVGNVIGTGVFKKIVPMAATGLNQSTIIAAWVVAGLIALFGAFTIAGLAKMTTSSGGIYEYLRLSFGDLPAFFYGWTYFIIIGTGGQAAVAFIFAQSVNAVIPLGNPLNSLSHISIGHFIYPFASSGIKILSVTTMVLLTWINYRGVKKGAGLNNVITIAKVLGIGAVIILGLGFIHTTNVQQLNAPTPLNDTSVYSAFFLAILSAYWAYNGFEDVALATGEIKNPKRNVPLAIIIGVLSAIIIYVLTNYAYMHALPLHQLAFLSDDQIAATVMVGKVLGETGTFIISLLIILSCLGSMNVGFVTQPRLMYRMAQENAFFKHAAKVHPRWRTPYVSLLYLMVWSIVLNVSGTFDMLSDMVIFANFLFFALLAAALIKMKRKHIITEKVPFYPIAPVLYIVFSLALLINTLIQETKLSLIGLCLICSGLPFYYLFKGKFLQKTPDVN